MGLPPFVDPQGRLFGFVSDVAAANGIPLSLMGHRWNETFINTGDTRAYAMSGDVIWHATDRLTLTFGLSWTRDEKDLTWHHNPRSAPTQDAPLAPHTAIRLFPPPNHIGLPG